MDKSEKFDFRSFEQQAIKGLRDGKPLEGKDGVLAARILLFQSVELSLEWLLPSRAILRFTQHYKVIFLTDTVS
jgi:hypothetical protein